MNRPRCSECGAPARLAIGAEDIYAEHCSNACALARWEKDVAQGGVVCVGEITVSKIDEALSTTGWELPGGEA